MKDQYNRIFWGIIIATFHINLGIVRILPEFIGWWMISSACFELYDISKNAKFMKARKVSGVMVIWSLVASLLYLGSISGIALDIVQFAPVVFTMMEMLFAYQILEASAENFFANEKMELHAFYIHRTGVSSILYGVEAVSLTVALLVFDSFFITASAFLGIGIRIWMALMMKSMSQEWELPVNETETVKSELPEDQ